MSKYRQAFVFLKLHRSIYFFSVQKDI